MSRGNGTVDMDMKAVIDAARQGVAPTPFSPDAARVLFVPNADGGAGELVSLEKFLATPLRKRGVVTVFDAASFNQVVRDNDGAGDCVIYLDRNPEKPAVEAVLNSHGKRGPGWCDFRVRIEFRPTPQWSKWMGINGKLMPQVEFAEFIEDNLSDIESPPGAQMLEVATQLQGMRTLNFKRGVRLSDGNVQFEHVEDTQARVGAGNVAVPEALVLRLAPLQGCPVYAVPARFRWRLGEGKLSLGIKLERVEDLMTRVIEDIVAKIERSTDISVIEGKPPGAVVAE